MPKADKLSRAIGTTTKKLRVQRGWTQDELAARSGTDSNFISSIERGKRRPSALKLWDLAQGFDMKPAEFVELVDIERNETLELILRKRPSPEQDS